jgi:hypothetical protein
MSGRARSGCGCLLQKRSVTSHVKTNAFETQVVNYSALCVAAAVDFPHLP